MLSKINHLGIAVGNLDESIELYKKLGFDFLGTETVKSEGVKAAFFQVGESKIELLEAVNQSSPIYKFLKKREGKGGFHHIAIEVSDLSAEIERLKQEGFTFLSEIPRDGANKKEVIFLHPKQTDYVLIELCQRKE